MYEFGYLLPIRLRAHCDRAPHHDLVEAKAGAGEHQLAEGHNTLENGLVIDDEHVRHALEGLVEPPQCLDGFARSQTDGKSRHPGGHQATGRVRGIGEQVGDPAGEVGLQPCDDLGLDVCRHLFDDVHDLCGGHLGEESSRVGRGELLQDLGCCFVPHLFEQVCSLARLEIADQLSCCFLVDRFEDVCSVVRVSLNEGLPLLVVGFEVLLCLARRSAR